MSKRKKSLTSDLYAEILETIGRSEKPLSAYEIKQKLVGTSDIYRLIKELCPSIDGYLFDLNKVLNKKVNQDFKSSFFRRVCEIFQLQRELNADYYSYGELQIEHEKTGREGSLTYLRYELFRFYFVVFLNPAGSGYLYLYESSNDELVDFRRLRYSQNRQKLDVYFETFTSYKHSHLSITFSERALKDIESIKRVDPERLLKENCIKLNRKNWKYVLNLRGLLRFIYAVRLEKNGQGRVRRILSNPSLKPEAIAPFLLYWQDFQRAGFNVVEALTQISSEFFYHLDQFHWNDDTLLHEVTGRYYKQMSGFFRHQDHSYGLNGDWKELNIETREKLNRYRIYILSLVQEWLQKELKIVDDDIEYYRKNPNLSRPL